MPGIDERPAEADAPGQLESTRPASSIEGIVDTITFEGRLAELIEFACEKALMYGSPSHADHGRDPNPGVQAAIRAYSEWKRTKEGSMDTEVHHKPGAIQSPVGEPEVLPLSLAGKWVAWSSDGMRIVAASESSEEAEKRAIAAGEAEPILERHPGRYRL